MARKVSVNKRFSKTQPNIIPFKSKRRRKIKINSDGCATTTTSSSIINSSIIHVQKRCKPLEAYEASKSSKHRWKLNESGSYDTPASNVLCMTSSDQCFQRQLPHNTRNLPHNADKANRKRHRRNDNINRVQSSIGASCTQHISSHQSHFHNMSTGGKYKPQKRDFVNCHKLLDWTTTSSVRKLLPIFILVNMLPFLYAGELIKE